MNNDSDLNGILQRIIVEPDCDLHRLVYADRLDELGEHGRAKFIRGSIENKGRGFECYSHPHHYDVGFDVVPAGFDRMCEYERGFIEMWITDAATFLRHADSLVWHPTQTIRTIDNCPKCEGRGGLKRARCPVCDGAGTISSFTPRPCPPTAQPIRRVVLTSWLEGNPSRDDVLTQFGREWPGIEFVLPSSGTEVASDDNEATEESNAAVNSDYLLNG